MQTISELNSQADGFGRYLIGQSPKGAARQLFIEAMENSSEPLEAEDEKLLRFIARHPASTGIIDAGLALIRPYSEVRRRLYVMLAILEASPDYVSYYLPQKRPPVYVLAVFYTGLKAAIKALAGIVLVKLLGRS